jgi:hypothetical protein
MAPVARTVRRSDGTVHMAEGDTFTCGDPDGYAARFGDVRVDLTVTGAGEFRARLVRLKMKHLQVYWCREDLPRIASISLPPERIFVSFPVGPESLTSNGLVLRKGDLILHGRGERTHQRSENACQWALISFSPEQFANCSKALLGHSIAPPQVSRIVRPPRAEWLGLQRLVRQACGLAEAQQKLFSPDVARALEQEILDAVIHCVASKGRDEKSRTRHHHAAVMVRFEEELDKYLDQKVAMPTLCAAIGVAERTLRMCCAEIPWRPCEAVSPAAPIEQSSGSVASRRSCNSKCRAGRSQSSIPGAWAVRGEVPHYLRGVPIDHTAPRSADMTCRSWHGVSNSAGIQTSRQINRTNKFVCRLPKPHSGDGGA